MANDKQVMIRIGVGATAVIVPLWLVIAASRRMPALRHLFAVAAKNQMLMAFFVPTALAGGLYSLKVLAEQIWARVSPSLINSITISSQDENFDQVLRYISAKVTSSTLVACTYKNKNKTWADWRKEFTQGAAKETPKFDFRPANSGAITSFFHKGQRIFIYRTPPQTITVGYSRKPTDLEKLTISTWSGHAVLKDILSCAVAEGVKEDFQELTIFVRGSGWISGWEKALSKARRVKESVVLEDGLMNTITDDARSFLNSAEWYYEKGIPYRRGYLLWGPPGCGKTSFCQYLAGELNLDLCLLNLSDDTLTDEDLACLLRESPRQSLILLEDVDAVFVGRDLTLSAQKGKTGISFSGLLNAIDGVASQEGRIFVMTTNHPEKLDPALVRPGRIDVKIELKRASKHQAKELFLRFFPGDIANADAFAKIIPENKVSMAQLQGHLVENKGDADAAVSGASLLLNDLRESHNENRSVYQFLVCVPPLEKLTPVLNEHGFILQHDLKGVGAGDIKNWCKGYGILSNEHTFLKLKDTLMDPMSREHRQGMEMVDHNVIRTMVYSQFYHSLADQTPESTPGGTPTGAFPILAKGNSNLSLLRQQSFTESKDRSLEEAVNTLASKLMDNEGRGLVSCYQLQNHLSLYADSLVRAVKTADAMRKASQKHPQLGGGCMRTPTYEVLLRCGLEKHAWTLEDEGYTTAKSLVRLTEADLTDIGLPKKDAKVLAAVLQEDTSKGDFVLNSMLATRFEAISMFKCKYPSASSNDASVFGDCVSNEDGSCNVSRLQICQFLSKHDTAKNALESADEFALCKRPPRPEKPKKEEPEGWIHGVLKEAKLDDYSAKFIDAGLVEKEDFSQGGVPLTIKDLETLGVDKLGARMKIMSIIKPYIAAAATASNE